jgi:aminoglycoside phosphotransferase (APT) family kinase protein
MSSDRDTLQAALAALLPRLLPWADGIAGLQRLTAGATLQTWAFDAVGEGGRRLPLILRRSPGGLRGAESLSLTLEAALLRALAGSGVPVAEVLHAAMPEDGIGDGFLMTRIAGETIPRKLLRDEAFAAARPRLVGELGAALGALHRVPVGKLPALPLRSTYESLQRLQQRCEGLAAEGRPSAVFAYALRWLHANCPDDPPLPRLVHGDFRIGNVIVDGQGLRAVLDWEIAHLGDPAEDLAWICLPPWRFGQIERPVAGLGTRAELFDAWQAATGERVDAQRVRWWQMLGSLRWGVGCAGMHDWFASGRDPSVERAMIARRVSENELDLLRLLREDTHA